MTARAAMMAAIRDAASATPLFTGSSLSNGLRAIRTFERVNDLTFDPFNETHRVWVRGMGVHEQLFRRIYGHAAQIEKRRFAA